MAQAVPCRDAATRVVQTLRDHGHTAYFAGGCVRDELLGLDPTDYDIATDAHPERVAELFRRTQQVGAAFGVVLVPQPPSVIEVATFRSDGSYSDRRRPDEVHFSDEVADANRRDFTVNALFLDPLEPSEGVVRGRIIDHVGGQDDLRAGVIRAVGDPEARLAEDHLRALRAVRFAARLGFTIEDGTAGAIREHASELSGVSRERLGDEIRRMLGHPTRGGAVAMLSGLGLDDAVLGEAVEHDPDLLHRVAADASFAVCCCAWMLDRGLKLRPDLIGTAVSTWRKSLCLSNAERDAIRTCLEILGSYEHEWDALSMAARKRLSVRAPGRAGRWSTRSSRMSRSCTLQGDYGRSGQAGADPSGLGPDPLLNGDDLVTEGFASGPLLGRILEVVYDAQLEDRISSREEALELARSLCV